MSSDQETKFFGSEESDQIPEQKPNVEIPLPDEAKELIGEGKKYKDPVEALKALPHAQKHISTLEEENRRLREENEKRKSSESMLEELRKLYEKPLPATEVPDVQKVVLDTLNRVESEKTKEFNLKVVHEEMTKLFGTKAEEMVQQKAKELGYPISELKREAQVSPKAFLQRFQGSVSTPSSSKGSVNTEAMSAHPAGAEVGTKAYYDLLRKSDPGKFYSSAVQNQMFKDRKEKGEKFYQ